MKQARLSSFDLQRSASALAISLGLHGALLLGAWQFSAAWLQTHQAGAAWPPTAPLQLALVAWMPTAEATAAKAPVQAVTALPKPQRVRPPVSSAGAALMASARNPLPAPEAPTPDHLPDVQAAVSAEAAPPQTAPKAPSAALADAPSAHALHPPLQQARPDYAYNPPPDYPPLLREQGVGGVVWLRVRVGADGQPGSIALLKGSGWRLLDESALRAVSRWRFVPARRGEQSLASWVEFPVRFAIRG